MTCIVFQNHFIISTSYSSQTTSTFLLKFTFEKIFFQGQNVDLFQSVFRKYPLIFAWKKWVRNITLCKAACIFYLLKEIKFQSTSASCAKYVCLYVLLFIFCHQDLMLDSQTVLWPYKVKFPVLESSSLAWTSIVLLTQYPFRSE